MEAEGARKREATTTAAAASARRNRISRAHSSAQDKVWQKKELFLSSAFSSLFLETRYTLVPIKEAQEAAGAHSGDDESVSRAQHRRSLSLGSAAVVAGVNLPPSPFSLKKQPPSPPPAGKRVVKATTGNSPPARPKKDSVVSGDVAPAKPVVVAADDDWAVTSINSDTCAFDWERLNASNTDSKIETVKCLVVGDVGVGKTVLCKTMLGDAFDPSYKPTVFETYKIRG